MPSVNVLKFKIHYSFWIFKYVNIFSDWWIMPDVIPDENTANQPEVESK